MFYLFHIWNFVVVGIIIAFLKSRLRYIWDKQASGTLAAFFLIGCASTVIFWIVDALYPLNYFFPFFHSSDFLYSVFITGITEESSKFIAFLLIARGFKSIKEPQDGVIQGAIVGLAFGMVENWFYFDRYPDDWFMMVRPILTAGGHAIYGGIWGGMYSAAVYSNLYSKDSSSYRLAFYGLFGTAIIHGLYNAALFFIVSIFIDITALLGSTFLFLRLVESSPYRKYFLSEADKAIPNIRRGLHFNPKSSILNRSLGHFLLYQGKYKLAAKHLAKSMPTAFDSRKARFFVAACEITYLPEYNATQSMRIAWGRMNDDQRTQYMKQLAIYLQNDPNLLNRINEIINKAFKTREWMAPHKLADELRRRKAETKLQKARNPSFKDLASELSQEEKEKLAAKLSSR